MKSLKEERAEFKAFLNELREEKGIREAVGAALLVEGVEVGEAPLKKATEYILSYIDMLMSDHGLEN